MNRKTKTRVIFKMSEDECVAFLLDCPANPGFMLSYMHIGQHGEASIAFYKECKPATKEEYRDLYNELESIGYHLDIQEGVIICGT